jgi:hypothetical protein
METWATYWSGPTAADAEGEPVDHIASDQFHEAGVEVGDRLYVITYRGGCLHVVTSIVVGQLVPQQRAEAILRRNDLWDARWHVVARPETVRRATMSATLTERQIAALAFIGRDGEPAEPARNRHGAIDPQTFRTTRRVDAATTAVLEKALATSR